MKSLTLLTLLLGLSPQASLAAPIAYDENSSSDALVIVAPLKEEPQLISTQEDTTRARIVAVINKSAIGSTAQTMKVYVDGTLSYEWKVSTGREKSEVAKSGRRYRTTTPIGYFRPTKIELNHFSNTWKADMPHSVFFIGGIAAHGSNHIEQLGSRASGGCVRLAPENAKTFYELITSLDITDVVTIDRKGNTVLDENGNPVLMNNRDVLIIVENHE